MFLVFFLAWDASSCEGKLKSYPTLKTNKVIKEAIKVVVCISLKIATTFQMAL